MAFIFQNYNLNVEILKECAHQMKKCVIVVTHSNELAKQADVVLRLKKVIFSNNCFLFSGEWLQGLKRSVLCKAFPATHYIPLHSLLTFYNESITILKQAIQHKLDLYYTIIWFS